MAGSEPEPGGTSRAASTVRIDRPTMLALGGMALAIFVVANDFSALSVALPAIERRFHVDVSTVQWTINAYTLWFGVLTVTGGRLADLLGRRRVLVTGAIIFAVCERQQQGDERAADECHADRPCGASAGRGPRGAGGIRG